MMARPAPGETRFFIGQAARGVSDRGRCADGLDRVDQGVSPSLCRALGCAHRRCERAGRRFDLGRQQCSSFSASDDEADAVSGVRFLPKERHSLGTYQGSVRAGVVDVRGFGVVADVSAALLVDTASHDFRAIACHEAAPADGECVSLTTDWKWIWSGVRFVSLATPECAAECARAWPTRIRPRPSAGVF